VPPVTGTELREVAERIWGTLFEEPLQPADDAAEMVDDTFLTGCVHIEGSHQAAVAVRCPVGLARQFTSKMMGVHDPSPADVCDALGELTNLTAGSVQALMPPPSELTLPTVVENSDHHPQSSYQTIAQAHFRFDSEPLTVSLLCAGPET